jgi:hypothetical protein
MRTDDLGRYVIAALALVYVGAWWSFAQQEPAPLPAVTSTRAVPRARAAASAVARPAARVAAPPRAAAPARVVQRRPGRIRTRSS